ncbi:ankyrin repeat domain 53 [Cetorhinus maximus]
MTTNKVKKWNRGEMMSDELMAASVGDVDWLRISLRKAKNKIAVDQNGYNAVHLAAFHGRMECLKVLVEEHHMDVNLTNPNSWSPIHLVLNKECQPRALECLKYLLSVGADPNVQTNDGLTPLHQAAEVGLLDCIITLVEAGAKVKVRDSRGHRPIDLAKIWGHRGCARYLADVTWGVNRAEFSKQMEKLQKLKLILLADEKYQSEIHQEEKESLANESFMLWLERKHLSNVLRASSSFVKPHRTAAELMAQQLRDSVKVEGRTGSGQTFKLVPFTKPRGPCQSRRHPGSAKAGLEREEGRGQAIPGSKTTTCTTSRKGVCRAKAIWNVSTNPTSLPMADISGRMKGDPDVDLNSLVQQHDFGILYQLVLDHVGQPELRTKVRERRWPLPTLPLNIIKKELFPDSIYHRMKIPDEFKAVNVLDLPKKRWLVKEKSEIGMHLREWLEPNMSCLMPSSSHPTPKVESTSPSACTKRTSQPLQSGKKCQRLSLAATDSTNLTGLEGCGFESRDESSMIKTPDAVLRECCTAGGEMSC